MFDRDLPILNSTFDSFSTVPTVSSVVTLNPGNRMIRVCHLFTSPGHNFVGHHGGPPGKNPILEADRIECVAGHGIRGDRYFDFKENYKSKFGQDLQIEE